MPLGNSPFAGLPTPNWMNNVSLADAPAVAAPPLVEMEIVMGAEGPIKVKKRKPISQNGDDLIGDVFQLATPPTLDSDRFLRAWPDLKPSASVQLIAPKSLIGIEVEVENVLRIGPNIPLFFWVVKEDGSLRNNGREFVTPGVLPVSAAEAALRLLRTELNGDVDFSRRTSIHIHLDVRQLSFKQLLGMLYTYTAVENLLFKFVGNNRRSNIFCVPLAETGVMDRMQYNPTEFLHRIETNWHKYTALNLLPIGRQGSVEFRHMPGTFNIQQIINWIDLICCLKIYAYKNSLDTIINDITRLNSNSRYHQFVESVFQDRCIYLDMANLLPDMEKAVYLIKHCAMANAFNTYVKIHGTLESQFGNKVQAWMKKLSPEQIDALNKLAVKAKRSDLEELFKSVIRTPYDWLKVFSKPEQQEWIQIIIGNKISLEKAKRGKHANTIDYALGTLNVDSDFIVSHGLLESESDPSNNGETI